MLDWFMNGGHVLLTLATMVLCAAVHWARTPKRTPRHFAELLLMYSLGVAGFKGIFAGFLMHTVWADAMAASIGWPAGNPFQTEVAFANLAFGVLGALCFWRRDFWLPTIVGGSILAMGAGLTHAADLMAHGNLAPNNAGAILYADFLVPLARIALYIWLARTAAANLETAPKLAPK